MTQYSWNVHRAALQHGVSHEQISHALRHHVAEVELDSDTRRRKLLLFGPDHAGNFLELIALVLTDSELLVIHAMPLRPRVRRLMWKEGKKR